MIEDLFIPGIGYNMYVVATLMNENLKFMNAKTE